MTYLQLTLAVLFVVALATVAVLSSGLIIAHIWNWWDNTVWGRSDNNLEPDDFPDGTTDKQ